MPTPNTPAKEQPELKVKRVKRYWWIGRYPGALFFGQSCAEVVKKFDDWRRVQQPEQINTDRLAEILLTLP